MQLLYQDPEAFGCSGIESSAPSCGLHLESWDCSSLMEACTALGNCWGPGWTLGKKIPIFPQQYWDFSLYAEEFWIKIQFCAKRDCAKGETFKTWSKHCKFPPGVGLLPLLHKTCRCNTQHIQQWIQLTVEQINWPGGAQPITKEGLWLIKAP